eukprot:EG_transcript_8256
MSDLSDFGVANQADAVESSSPTTETQGKPADPVLSPCLVPTALSPPEGTTCSAPLASNQEEPSPLTGAAAAPGTSVAAVTGASARLPPRACDLLLCKPLPRAPPPTGSMVLRTAEVVPTGGKQVAPKTLPRVGQRDAPPAEQADIAEADPAPRLVLSIPLPRRAEVLILKVLLVLVLIHVIFSVAHRKGVTAGQQSVVTEIQGLQMERDVARAALSEEQHRAQQERGRGDVQEQELRSLRRELEEERTRAQRLVAEIQGLRKERDMARVALSEEQLRAQQVVTEIQGLRMERDVARAALSEEQHRAQQVVAEIQGLRKERDMARVALSEEQLRAQQEWDAARGRGDVQEQELHSLRRELEEERARAQRRVKDLQAEIAIQKMEAKLLLRELQIERDSHGFTLLNTLKHGYDLGVTVLGDLCYNLLLLLCQAVGAVARLFSGV